MARARRASTFLLPALLLYGGCKRADRNLIPGPVVVPSSTPTMPAAASPTPTPTLVAPTSTRTPTFTPAITYTPSYTRTYTYTRSATPTPTLAVTPPSPVFVGCSSEDSTYFASCPVTGYTNINLSECIAPLCDGWVLAGDKNLNRVNVLHVPTGTIWKYYQLSGAPREILYDPVNGLAYAGLSGSSFISKIDLGASIISNIALTDVCLDLALANGGKIWAVLDDNLTWPNNPLMYIDGPSGTVIKTWIGNYDSMLAFDQAGSQLFIGDEGYSPNSLRRFSFDAATTTLALVQSRSVGSNGEELAVSPDGTHLVYPSGSGNGSPPYTIWNFSTSDLNTVYGEYNTGAYPEAADYSPNMAYVAATDGSYLKIFDMTSHVYLTGWSLPGASISVRKTLYSRGGGYAYALYDYSSTSRVFWAKYP